MKHEEEIAEKFIKEHFNVAPVYEPNGNATFPDFLISDQKIAVEVRSLNEVDDSSKDIETFYVAENIIKKCSQSILNAPKDQFFLVDFDCPNILDPKTGAKMANKKNELITILCAELNKFIENGCHTPYSVDGLDYNCYLEIIENTNKSNSKQTFTLVGHSQTDNNYSIDSIINSIQYCINDKTRKISKNYEEYWLILINKIRPISVETEKHLIEKVLDKGAWRKICILTSNTSPIIL